MSSSLVELQRTVAPAGAVLVEPRILRRVIRRHRRLSGFALEVLHGQCYTLPRADLLAIVDVDELPAVDLAEEPILLPIPDGDVDATTLWRRIYHCRVHQALARRALTPAQVRQRVHRIGQAEFDEIRYVLRQEELLLPPRDLLETYSEFAALYLELRHFDRAALARTFPTLLDPAAVDAILADDVDVPVEGAPPAPAPPPAAAEPATPPPAAAPAGDADAARARGNFIRAALLRARAGEDAGARADLAELCRRLVAALGAGDAPTWERALSPLLVAERMSVEGRLLYDLQKAVHDHEHEPQKVDLAAYVVSLGRRPVVRPLPAAREVRVARHLQAASAKLARLRIAEDDRATLAALLHRAAEHADDRVRELLAPPIDQALDEVGLVPCTVPERVARKKLVAELLDHVVSSGFLSLGHVRDAISRSDVKLADLSGPGELVRGDALLRIDRRFARTLDGVYRRGEVYLRFLQMLSSLFFGTRPGRFLTLYALLPLLASYLILQGLQHIVEPLSHLLFDKHPRIYSVPALAAVTIYLFGLIHSADVRAASLSVMRSVGRGVRAILWDAPRAVWRLPAVQRLARSPLVAFLLRNVVRPGVPAAALAYLVGLSEDGETAFLAGGVAFFVIGGFLSSRAGVEFQELMTDFALRTGRDVGTRLLPALFRLILDVFKLLLELLDRLIYTVDEWLRFRQGESRVALVVKAGLGGMWAVVRYVIRIYVNLLIEPTVNPIKHFPVVTVGGKIMVPFVKPILEALRAPLVPVVGNAAANAFAGLTVLFLPGLWGFLAWELKENWRLYAANRARELRPAAIGSHGETMARLLRPGLHSGTVPKAYARLRRAAWRRSASQAKHREALHHVEEAVRRFVERELAAILHEAGWDISVGTIHIASNRIRVELRVPDGPPAWIAFEEQSGLILAGLAPPGFAASLDPERRRVLENALAGFYKLAAVDLVREQIEREIPPGSPYDVADEGLVVWPGGDFSREIVEDLRAPAAERLLFARRPVTWSAWVQTWQGGAGRLAENLL